MYFVPATECVRVVVDYGTFADSPDGPNTHCTGVPSGATAAEALARRANDLGATAPRYKGNFLCGIDGYPQTGCGDDPNVPYWSVWIFRHGGWTYSSYGVDTLTVSDGDKDGHPDPIGFRYQPQGPELKPRSNPAYPKPTPTTTTPAPVVTTSAAPAPTRSGSRPPRTTPATARPTTTPTTSAPPVAAAEPTTPPGIAPARTPKQFPFGTALASIVALLLLGGAGWRSHRTRAP